MKIEFTRNGETTAIVAIFVPDVLEDTEVHLAWDDPWAEYVDLVAGLKKAIRSAMAAQGFPI